MLYLVFRKSFLTLVFLCFLSSNSYAVGGLVVGAIIDQLESTAESLIDKGFDRLDNSIVNAGNEAKSTAAALRIEYSGILDKTVESLDDVQRKAIQDIQGMVNKVDAVIVKNTNNLAQVSRETLSPIYSLFSGKPLLVGLQIEHDNWKYDSFIITGKGVSVTEGKAQLYVNNELMNLKPIKASATKISYRINKEKIKNLTIHKNKVTVIPVKIEMKFCDGFWVFCKNRLVNYFSEITIFPEIIGTVKLIIHLTKMNQ